MNRTMARSIVRFLAGSRAKGDWAGTLGSCRPRDWDQAMDWLHRSGLALHFWQRVKDSDLHEALTESLRARLERNFRDNQVRVASMAEEFQLLNRQFQSAGIDFAVIKGFALVPEYCPQAALRMQFDHDYFLRPDSLRQAEEVLRACGYIPKPSRHEVHPLVYAHSLRAPRFPVDWDGFYSPQLYRSVELHIRLWEAEREKIRIMLPEDPLGRTRVHEWQGLRFQTLDGVDALVYQTLHALRHILNNWCRLSILFEIANFLDHRAGDTAFWEEFNKRIRRRHLLPEAVGVVFSLAARLFSVPIPVRAAAFSIPTAVLSAWVERYGLSSALENFSGNKFSLFLHREFVESDAGWREVRSRRLFPIQSPLQAAKVSTQQASSRTAARWRQCKHAARRFRYHLISALLYALHWPLWKRTQKRLSEEGLLRRPSGVAGAAGSVRTVVESFD